jgi:hypothetical protein
MVSWDYKKNPETCKLDYGLKILYGYLLPRGLRTANLLIPF